ncbi:MAG: YybH family protein [bacterium]
MRTTIIYVLLLSICLGCSKQNTISKKKVTKKISANWEGFIEAWEAENTDEVISFYTENGINIPPRGVQRVGRENIAKFYNVLFENNLSSKYQHNIISLEIADSIAIEHGEFEVDWVRNDSVNFKFNARSVTHWKQQKDGDWKIQLFIYNQPPYN